MPALPALLLSIHLVVLLLTTASPSYSQGPVLSSVRMGKPHHCPTQCHSCSSMHLTAIDPD